MVCETLYLVGYTQVATPTLYPSPQVSPQSIWQHVSRRGCTDMLGYVSCDHIPYMQVTVTVSNVDSLPGGTLQATCVSSKKNVAQEMAAEKILENQHVRDAMKRRWPHHYPSSHWVSDQPTAHNLPRLPPPPPLPSTKPATTSAQDDMASDQVVRKDTGGSRSVVTQDAPDLAGDVAGLHLGNAARDPVQQLHDYLHQQKLRYVPGGWQWNDLFKALWDTCEEEGELCGVKVIMCHVE